MLSLPFSLGFGFKALPLSSCGSELLLCGAGGSAARLCAAIFCLQTTITNAINIDILDTATSITPPVAIPFIIITIIIILIIVDISVVIVALTVTSTIRKQVTGALSNKNLGQKPRLHPKLCEHGMLIQHPMAKNPKHHPGSLKSRKAETSSVRTTNSAPSDITVPLNLWKQEVAILVPAGDPISDALGLEGLELGAMCHRLDLSAIRTHGLLPLYRLY